MSYDFEYENGERGYDENDEYKIEQHVKLFGRTTVENGKYKRKLFCYKFAFRNKKTGKLCKERYERAYFVNKKFAVVYINNEEWTFLNLKTGKPFEQKFLRPFMGLSKGWAPVYLGPYCYTFFNPITGELRWERFHGTHALDRRPYVYKDDKFVSYYKGWAPVEICAGKWTYFNVITGKFYDRIFDYADFIDKNGWAPIQLIDDITSRSSYLNFDSGKICEQRFVHARPLTDGIGEVTIVDNYYYDMYFEPSSGKLFEKMPQEKSNVKENQQKQHHEEGKTLPKQSTSNERERI